MPLLISGPASRRGPLHIPVKSGISDPKEGEIASKHTMPRALKNLDITLGLAVIPVQLFTATSSQGKP
jgi:hypothetical protein